MMCKIPETKTREFFQIGQGGGMGKEQKEPRQSFCMRERRKKPPGGKNDGERGLLAGCFNSLLSAIGQT